MALLVQKYGGTSLASVERIHKVARHIAQQSDEGHKLVVVVSAMGDETNRLKSLAYELAARPSLRELDVLLTAGERVSMSLLSIGLNACDVPCVSFTGSQSGIITDTQHGNARIKSILGDRIQSALDSGKVAIVAGFQGMAMPTKDITTLGRGGSDLTAVALAHRLQADLCEIYTDVEGVYNGDPRFFSQAKLLPKLSHKDLANLAWAGAGVVHTRAAQLAAKFAIPLRIRSSFTLDHTGTSVVSAHKPSGDRMEKAEIIGITHRDQLCLVTLTVARGQTIAELHRELNTFFWGRDAMPLLQNYTSNPQKTSVQLVFDQGDFSDFQKEVVSKFKADCERDDDASCVNVVGSGFLQDLELVCDLIATVGNLVKAFSKTNDLLKIIVPQSSRKNVCDRLQGAFLSK